MTSRGVKYSSAKGDVHGGIIKHEFELDAWAMLNFCRLTLSNATELNLIKKGTLSTELLGKSIRRRMIRDGVLVRKKMAIDNPHFGVMFILVPSCVARMVLHGIINEDEFINQIEF